MLIKLLFVVVVVVVVVVVLLLLFFFFQSQYIISYFLLLLSIVGEKNVRNYFVSLSAHSGASYTHPHTCLICVSRTVQLLLINITF